MTDTIAKSLPPPPSYPPTGPANANVATSSAQPETLETSAPPAGRLPNGRFNFGNPGKPRGARNRTSREIETLLEGSAAEVTRCLIGQAQLGSLDAQKWILDRCAPPRKGRVVVLDDFPEIRGPADIAPALSATAAGVANGVISAVVANVLQKFLDVLETAHRLWSRFGAG